MARKIIVRSNIFPTSEIPETGNASPVVKGQSAPKFTAFFKGDVFNIWALGILIVIGGDCFSWNAELKNGFGSMITSVMLTGTAYVSYVFCSGELFSGLPFSGGAYGIIRCTFDFFPGFLIGCSEAIEYIGYTSMSAIALISLIGTAFPFNEITFHALLILFFVLASLLQIFVAHFCLKRLNTALGVLCFLSMLLYCFGTLRWTRAKRILKEDVPLFSGGLYGFCRTFPLPSWLFIGVESLTFASPLTVSPKTAIPWASVGCVLTLFVVAVFVLTVASAAPPGIHSLSTDAFPLNNGFSLIFGCSYQKASLLSIPATFATAYGFIFSFSQLFCGLAESGLVPKVLGMKTSNGSPYAAILIGCFTSYAVCLALLFAPAAGNYLYRICFLSAYVTYFCQFISYIYIKKRFGGLKFPFKSPFGIFGAVYGCIIFVFAAVSISFFQVDYVALPALLGLWFLLSLYYFLHAKNRQKFSLAEQKSVLVAHTIKYNCRRSRRSFRKRKAHRVQVRLNLSNMSGRESSRGSVLDSKRSSMYDNFSGRFKSML